MHLARVSAASFPASFPTDRWSMSRAVYFTFITTSTVGLGDMTLGWDSMQQVVLGIVVVMPGLVVFTLFTSLGAEWSARTARAANKQAQRAIDVVDRHASLCVHNHHHHRTGRSPSVAGSSSASTRRHSSDGAAPHNHTPRRDSPAAAGVGGGAGSSSNTAKVFPEDPSTPQQQQGDARSAHTQVEEFEAGAAADNPGTSDESRADDPLAG